MLILYCIESTLYATMALLNLPFIHSGYDNKIQAKMQQKIL